MAEELTAKAILEERLGKGLAAHPEKADGVDCVFKFDISGPTGGLWVLDLKAKPPVMTTEDREEVDCTIIMKEEDFIAMVEGTLRAELAFMTGKLKIKGDMFWAMKLKSLLK
jgi:putative sterol carrier protein